MARLPSDRAQGKEAYEKDLGYEDKLAHLADDKFNYLKRFVQKMPQAYTSDQKAIELEFFDYERIERPDADFDAQRADATKKGTPDAYSFTSPVPPARPPGADYFVIYNANKRGKGE